MPTYTYACTSCGEELEVVQSLRDEPLSECPACSGRLRKVFHPVGVMFKGSGFYRTDSREATGTKAGGTKGSGDSSSTKASAETGGKGGKAGSTDSGTGSSGAPGSSTGVSGSSKGSASGSGSSNPTGT